MNSSAPLPDPNESKAPEMIGIASLLLFISTLVVALRVVSRAMIRQIGWDDWAAMATLVFIIASGSTIMSMTRYGLGRHIYTIPPESLVLYGRAFWISILTYMMALGGVKLTFLLQYFRLMSVSRLRHVYLGAIVFIAVWSISQVILLCLQCIPLHAVWDPSVKGRCLPNVTAWWYFNGIFNIVTDFAILAMPFPVLLKLQLPKAQRVVLAFVFGLGFFTIGVSIARMQWLTPDPDITWWNVKPATWSLSELTSAITCACLPTLKPLFVRVKPFFSKASAGDSTLQLQSVEGERETDIESNVTGAGSKEQLSHDTKPPNRVYSYGIRTQISATSIRQGTS